jgi:hypothetical protein
MREENEENDIHFEDFEDYDNDNLKNGRRNGRSGGNLQIVEVGERKDVKKILVKKKKAEKNQIHEKEKKSPKKSPEKDGDNDGENDGENDGSNRLNALGKYVFNACRKSPKALSLCAAINIIEPVIASDQSLSLSAAPVPLMKVLEQTLIQKTMKTLQETAKTVPFEKQDQKETLRAVGEPQQGQNGNHRSHSGTGVANHGNTGRQHQLDRPRSKAEDLAEFGGRQVLTNSQ